LKDWKGNSEVVTLDWAEKVTNCHVLKGWGRNLGLSREGYELSRVEELRSKPWTEPRGSRTITCWRVEVKTLDWAKRVTNYHVLKS